MRTLHLLVRLRLPYAMLFGECACACAYAHTYAYAHAYAYIFYDRSPYAQLRIRVCRPQPLSLLSTGGVCCLAAFDPSAALASSMSCRSGPSILGDRACTPSRASGLCLRSQSFESAAMATSRMQEAQARRGNDGVRSGEGFAPGASPTGVSREQPSMAAAAAAATSAAAESPPPGAPARATHAAAPEGGPPPPGAPAGASGEEEQTWMNDRQILYARELRQRFALPGGPMLLNPRMVGFDTSNRDGIPINGFRCDKLLADIEAMAFDPDEANHDNVCI